MPSVTRLVINVCAAFALMGSAPLLLVAQVSVSPDQAASGGVSPYTDGQIATFTVVGRGRAYLDCWGTVGIKCSVATEIDLTGENTVEVTFSTSGREGSGYLFLRTTVYGPDSCRPESGQCDKHVDVGSRTYAIEPQRGAPSD